MSTSISVFAEIIQNGKWVSIANFNSQGIHSKHNQQRNFPVKEVISLGQDYELFAVLAGVRKEKFNLLIYFLVIVHFLMKTGQKKQDSTATNLHLRNWI